MAVAPFWGPKTRAAWRNGVVTSQATVISIPSNCSAEPTVRTAPQPPSVVAEPPQPTTMRRTPASRAARRRVPTPAVSARTGSSPRGWGRRARPAARDISMTAVRPGWSVVGSIRHSAMVGAPSGPGTSARWTMPPNASRSPSPPSEKGNAQRRPPRCVSGHRHCGDDFGCRGRPSELVGGGDKVGHVGGSYLVHRLRPVR